MIATYRKRIACLALVHPMTLSSVQMPALEHKLGPHRLVGNTQKIERHF